MATACNYVVDNNHPVEGEKSPCTNKPLPPKPIPDRDPRYVMGLLFNTLTELGPLLAQFQADLTELEKTFKENAKKSTDIGVEAIHLSAMGKTVASGLSATASFGGIAYQGYGISEVSKVQTNVGAAPMNVNAAFPGQPLPPESAVAGAPAITVKHNKDLADMAYQGAVNDREGVRDIVLARGNVQVAPDRPPGMSQAAYVEAIEVRANGDEIAKNQLLDRHAANVEDKKYVLDDAQRRLNTRTEKARDEWVTPVDMTVKAFSEVPNTVMSMPNAIADGLKSEADNAAQTCNSEGNNVSGFRGKLGETLTEALSVAGRANDVRFGG